MYKYYLYIYYNMPKQTYKGGQRFKRKKKAKTVDGRQNQRLSKLEKLILPSVEIKSRDVGTLAPTGASSGADIPSTGYNNYPMFQLEQGTASDERIGDKVTIISHNISLSISAPDTTNMVRVIWLYTPSTTPLTISQVLEYGSFANHRELVFSSPYKRKAVSAENTYKILFDKVYNFKSNHRVQTDKFQLIPNKNGRQVHFQTTSSDMPENYQLQVLAISDSEAVSHPVMHYVCRTRYMDL